MFLLISRAYETLDEAAADHEKMKQTKSHLFQCELDTHRRPGWAGHGLCSSSFTWKENLRERVPPGPRLRPGGSYGDHCHHLGGRCRF